MPDDRSSNPGRILAPLALAVCAIAFFAVVLGSGNGDGEGRGERPAKERTGTNRKQSSRSRRRPGARATTYTVKTGDTLAGIAGKTGVPVERLQELNPELDPQALVSGQTIRLRE